MRIDTTSPIVRGVLLDIPRILSLKVLPNYFSIVEKELLMSAEIEQQ
jgi:hypothetical protein